MRYLKVILMALLPILLLYSGVIGQNTNQDLQSVFVDLTKHKGWGPFSARVGFEPKYYTGTFNIAGEWYKIFQIKHKSDQYEERFIIRKKNAEVTFTEKEGGGAIVYHRYDEINLEGTTFDIFGVRGVVLAL